MELQTTRMRLVAATAPLVGKEMNSHEALGQALGANIPANWPPALLIDALPWFFQQLTSTPELSGWLCWYGICEPKNASEQDNASESVLVASGGFLGMPQEGSVEVGYSVLPQFQGEGYATEMVTALVAWAFAHFNVQRVVAEVDRENTASLRVLAKSEFVVVGSGREAGHQQFARARRE